MVENTEFRALLNELDPRYKVPNRKYFSDSLVPEIYDEMRDSLKESLRQASFVSLTTDGWTSRANQSYITITCHFIDDDWQMQSYVLQTRILEESHTGANIAEVLCNALDEWEIKIENTALLTDNAANMGVAATAGGFRVHIGCFAHTLNLACQKGMGIDDVGIILKKLRRVVSHFHRSTTATAQLKTKMEQMEMKARKLVIDVDTRWNSTYDMIKVYLKLRSAVYAVFCQSERKTKSTKSLMEAAALTEEEALILEDMKALLKPMKKATKVISDAKRPTLSLVAPLKASLLRHLAPQDDPNPNDEVQKDSACERARNTMYTNLKDRYADPGIKLTMNMSSALDPRFKDLPFLDETTKQEVWDAIRAEALEVIRCKQSPSVSVISNKNFK